MKILITAPYMIKERLKVEPLLASYPIDVVWADVTERLEEEELLHYLQGVDGIICGDDRFSGRVYDGAKSLKVVVKWGTGIDSIQKEEADRRYVKVFRTLDAFTDPVADTTVGYALAFCRNLIGNDRILKNGGWEKPQGYALSERTVGIIGFGAIGIAVAKRLQACGARLLAYDVVDKPQAVVDQYGVTMVDLLELFAQSDIVTLHCDLNPSSRHLLNATAFATMQRHPYVINTSRGPLIDEASLINALRTGQINGAALDVFEQEPLAVDSPLRTMDNVLLAAHNSNSSPNRWHHVHRNSIRMLAEGLGLDTV